MASDVLISMSTRASTPVTPKPVMDASAPVTAGRQTVAANPGNNLSPVNQSEQQQQDQTAVSEFDIKEAVSNISDYVQNLERNLSFSVDEISGKTVITVTDPENDEVIRQIPSEALLAIAQHYAELQEKEGKGVLLEERV